MIELKFDSTIVPPRIEVPIYSESRDNVADGHYSEVQQTKVDGIMVPMVYVNKIFVPFTQVSSFDLTCEPVPAVHIVFQDDLELLKILDSPSSDNTLQIQILPPFDNAYKKINLTFYILRSSIEGTTVTLDGVYNIPHIHDNVMKAYGQVSTYELFEKVAKDYGLGFCSNIANTDDIRFIYNPNMSLESFLSKEVKLGGCKAHVLTWWIDYWNNLNLVDLYDGYKESVPDDKLQIWVVNTSYPQTTTDDKVEPVQTLACITNNPVMAQNQLYINEYSNVQDSVLVTDKNLETYNMSTMERSSTLIQDGDTKNDIFMGYEYGGEVFGQYDYLAQRASRDMFLNKINTSNIKVSLKKPTFGLMMGGKTNVLWYDVNKYITNPEVEKEQDNITSNIPLTEDLTTEENNYIVNKTISGQYYILESSIRYTGSGDSYIWSHDLVLGRYDDTVKTYNDISNAGTAKDNAISQKTQ